MVALSLVISSFGLLYLTWVALLCLTLIYSRKRECCASALSGRCILGRTSLARKAFQFPSLMAVISRNDTFAWVTLFVHVLATVGHKVSNYRKYGILSAAEEVVRAGVLSYAPGSESVHTFHLSHFHRLVWFCRFVFGCWGVFVCFAVAVFLFLTNLCDRVLNR